MLGAIEVKVIQYFPFRCACQRRSWISLNRCIVGGTDVAIVMVTAGAVVAAWVSSSRLLDGALSANEMVSPIQNNNSRPEHCAAKQRRVLEIGAPAQTRLFVQGAMQALATQVKPKSGQPLAGTSRIQQERRRRSRGPAEALRRQPVRALHHQPDGSPEAARR